MNIALLRSDLRFFIICATASLCVGLLINQFRDQPLGLIYQSKEARLNASVERISATKMDSATKPSPELSDKLSLDDMVAYVSEKRGVILDARPEIFHRLGHIPGAISLPRDDFEKAYEALKEKLEQNRTQPLAIYCSSSSCEDAELVRKALSALGYSQLTVFSGGWAEWTQAGKTEERD